MDAATTVTLVAQFGFPAVCLAVLAWWLAPRLDKLIDAHVASVQKTGDELAKQTTHLASIDRGMQTVCLYRPAPTPATKTLGERK